MIADPDLSASAPRPQLLATAMNALGHGMEALYGPGANPVSEGAALRAASLLATSLPLDPVPRPQAALGGLLGGWAAGMAGIAFHHAVCQTIVRELATPHAETNATMLPRTAAVAARMHPRVMGAFAKALGSESGDPSEAPGLTAELAGSAARPSLEALGVPADARPALADAIKRHPAWARGGLGDADLEALLA